MLSHESVHLEGREHVRARAQRAHHRRLLGQPLDRLLVEHVRGLAVRLEDHDVGHPGEDVHHRVPEPGYRVGRDGADEACPAAPIWSGTISSAMLQPSQRSSVQQMNDPTSLRGSIDGVCVGLRRGLEHQLPRREVRDTSGLKPS